MSYSLKYRLPWGTSAGSKIDWRLDIHQWMYPAASPTLDMVGSAEPVILQYIGSNDIYTEIIGSKLDINIITVDDDRVEAVYGDNINADTQIASTFPTNLLLREDDDSADLDQIFFTGTAAAVGTINETNTTGWVIYDTATGEEFEIPNSTDAAWSYTSSNTRYTINMAGLDFPQWLRDAAYTSGAISGNKTNYSVRTSTWTGTGTATTIEVARRTVDAEPYYDDFTTLKDYDGNLDPRAYKVFLRYKEESDTTYSTYWVGFITPLDSSVQYNTRPFVN